MLALVEGKGGEITSLQSQTEIINRSALTLEMRFEELRKDSITARQEILKSSGRIQPAGLSDIDKARFIILDREMPILIQKAKENVTSRAKSRLEKLKPSAETVSSKAAALLAERMAAMGVKTSVPSVSAPIQERVEDVEGDQRREMEKIVEIENRFQTLSAQIKSSFTTGVSSTSLVINEKFESGIGIRSRRGRELFEELMAISLPMTVDLNDMAPALDKVLVPKLDVESPFGSVRPVETNPFAFESAKLVQSSFGQSEVGNGVIQSNTVHPAVFSSNLGQNFPSVIGQFDNAIHDHPPNNQAQSGIKSPVTNSGFPHPTRKPAPPKPSKSAGLKPHPKIAPEPVPSSTPIFVSNLGPALVSSSSASTPFDGSRGRNESSRDPKTFSQSLESTSPLSKPVSDTAAPANIPFFTPVGGVMPPPPPPPPPTLSDGTVTPVRLPSTAERESSTSEVRPKPKPSDVGAQGPNLFALMNAVKDKVESITNTTPNVDIVKSDPHNFPPKLEISGTNPFHSTTSMLSAVPVSANPFGTPAFAHNPFDREKTTTVDSTKSNESGWEIVPKDDLYEVVVEFDYTSSGDNDLSVVTGSVLKVEQEDDEWLLCRTDNGSSGWIPKSFAKRKDVGDDASVYAIDPADESPSVPYEAGVEMSAEVLFDFEGRNEDEVTVNTGQIVFILSKEDEDWWKINANGLIGFVPQNFLREIHAEDGSVLSLQLKDDVGDSLNPFGSSAMIFTPSASEFPITAGEQFVDDLSTREGFSRKEAVQEMLVTERSYVDDLLTVQKQFILPLTQFKNIDTLKLFSNFLQIIEVNSVILTDFEECMATGSPIGTAFLKHLDNLQCYKIYCENLDLATSYLQKSRTLDPELNEFLKVIALLI